MGPIKLFFLFILLFIISFLGGALLYCEIVAILYANGLSPFEIYLSLGWPVILNS